MLSQAQAGGPLANQANQHTKLWGRECRSDRAAVMVVVEVM